MARRRGEVGHDGVVNEVPGSERRLVWGGGLPQLRRRRRSSVLGGYPKNSDNYPNTKGVFNTFKYTVRAQRDSDALCK
jgi:hypothetical protein